MVTVTKELKLKEDEEVPAMLVKAIVLRAVGSAVADVTTVLGQVIVNKANVEGTPDSDDPVSEANVEDTAAPVASDSDDLATVAPSDTNDEPEEDGLIFMSEAYENSPRTVAAALAPFALILRWVL